MTTSKPSKKNKWTRHYRDDKGVWEDVCIHGVGHEKGVHGCDGCCAELNKPSKKTEWETEFTKKFGYWLHGHLCTETSTNGKTPLKPAIEFIRSLLHQRDNEIREKIQGMKQTKSSNHPELGEFAESCECQDCIFDIGYIKALEDVKLLIDNT